MAFLDNLGDTIVDGTLTTVGRRRLAQAGGSLQIVKFAFGDDEINYELYDPDLTSANQSLTLLQTPIMEAFSNSKASIKYKLMRTLRQDLFYLPVLKINDGIGSARFGTGGAAKYVVLVDSTTVNKALPSATTTSGLNGGILNGFAPEQASNKVLLDQGIDNIAELTCPDDLRETQYIIRMDNRLGRLYAPGQNGASANVSGQSGLGGAASSFLDPDNVATYVLTIGGNDAFVSLDSAFMLNAGLQSQPTGKAVAGGFGSRLGFRIKSQLDVIASNYLWNVLGTSGTDTIQGEITNATYRYIDSSIDIFGNTTGVSISLPIRYVKYTG